MTTTPKPTETAKVRVYRAYQRGEATEEDVRGIFGENIDEFESFGESMKLVVDSVTNDAAEELFR